MDSLVKTVLNNTYYLESKIGEGGTGTIYRGVQIATNTNVAVKILHPQLVNNSNYLERFRREARAAEAINHPNAIQVIDFGVADEKIFYLVMELLEGISLREVIDRDKVITPEKTVTIITQVCAAVDAAHQQNIIHRDLKPENIVLNNHGKPNEMVKVLDFSIAKLRSARDGDLNLTEKGVVVGTPQYMSPEQAQGMELDTRADIYSLGIILYEMLTGDRPVKGTTPMVMMYKHIHGQPRPVRELNANVPPQLEAVVMSALAKKPEERPQTAKILSELLINAIYPQQAVPQPVSAAVTNSQPARPVQPLTQQSEPRAAEPPPKKEETTTGSRWEAISKKIKFWE